MLTIKCAYCQQVLGTKEGGEGVSHGICPKCLEEQNRLLEEMIREQKGVKNESKNSQSIT